MNQTVRTALATCILLLLIAGTAFAVRNPVKLDHQSPLGASHEPQPSASMGDHQDTGEQQAGDEQEASGEADDATGDGPPSAELVGKLRQRLSDAGIDADAAELADLVGAYGVGGAVRLLSWADASGTSIAELRKMRDGGMGWGQVAKQLNGADPSLQLSPGIGSIMSGGHGKGHGAGPSAAGKANGKATAAGQAKH